ncbi:MAG: tetratricopeptide repeat protein, partial [Planctomycetales bacterium]|nr:tetratricopeptide repeat protein [Planctomycetales bacterium]
GVLPWHEAVGIAHEIAGALAHAHGKGILHRDVKPSNILVGHKWDDEDVASRATRNTRSVFLTDFGLARLVATGSRLTTSGIAVGTPQYMSPEQARGEVSSLTPATDVWGLGCVLYEMLVGRPAFDGESPAIVIGRVVLSEPPSVRETRFEVPLAVDHVIRACLAKDPAWRLPDGAALREELSRVLEGRASPRKGRRAGVTKARVLVATAGLAGGGAIGLLAVALGSRDRPPVSPPDPAESPAAAVARRASALRFTDAAGAARLLAEAIAADPERNDWRLERGLLLWADGRVMEAREEWGRIPEGPPEREAARLYRGLATMFRLEKGTMALAEAQPDLAAAAAGAGRVGALARGALAASRRDWKAAREALRDLEGWEAALVRAHVESAAPEGDRAAAIREYAAAVRTGPPFAWAHCEKGVVRLETGDPEGALEDFELALRLEPEFPAALMNRAGVRLTLGDPARALEDLTAALRLKPDFAAALINRAIARRDLGDFPGAIADGSEALRIEPGNASALHARGVARDLSGDHAGAAEDFTALLGLRPDDPDPWACRAISRSASGDPAGALTDCEVALRLRPDHAGARNTRAIARKALGNPAGAEEDWRALLEAHPEHPEGNLNLGLARFEARDWRAAAEHLAAFLRISPGHPAAPDARRALDSCEARLGEVR